MRTWRAQADSKEDAEAVGFKYTAAAQDPVGSSYRNIASNMATKAAEALTAKTWPPTDLTLRP